VGLSGPAATIQPDPGREISQQWHTVYINDINDIGTYAVKSSAMLAMTRKIYLQSYIHTYTHLIPSGMGLHHLGNGSNTVDSVIVLAYLLGGNVPHMPQDTGLHSADVHNQCF